MKISNRPANFKEEYLKFQKWGYPDYVICKKMYVCQRTLYRWKKAVGLFENRKGWGIMNDYELQLSRRIAEVLGMDLKKVHGTEFVKLMEKLVERVEDKKERVGVSSDLCDSPGFSNVDIIKVVKELKEAYGEKLKMGMTLKDYQEISSKTWPKDKDKKELVQNASISLAEEVGEYLGILKKEMYHHHLENKLKKIDELGDVLYYVARHCDLMGVTLEEVATKNLVKIGKRYPNGYSDEASRERRE